jgi:hypothetical protein
VITAGQEACFVVRDHSGQQPTRQRLSARKQHSQKPKRSRAREANTDSNERKHIIHLRHCAFSKLRGNPPAPEPQIVYVSGKEFGSPNISDPDFNPGYWLQKPSSWR